MRHLAVVIVIASGCSSTAPQEKQKPAPAPDPLGPWGEDPLLTPPFALTQERRAPKLPDVRKEIDKLPERHLGALDDGLLLCHVEIARDVAWDAFAGPDARVRFQAGPRHAVELWGPENHWSFEVSIPRVTMREGDPILWALWDRDVGSDTEVGAASQRWDGEAPIAWSAPHAETRCQAATHEEAEAIARPMLEDIDATLAQMEATRPDGASIGLGDFDGRDEDLKGMFKRTWRDWGKHYPLRYAAGAVGWDSPEIQARLGRLAAAERGWLAACRALVDRERAGAAPRGSWVRVGDTHCPAGAEADCRAQPGFELRISSVRCGKPLAGPVDQLAVGSDCAIEFQRRGGGGGFCIPDEIDVVRADGSRSIASVPAEDAKGELVACNAPPPHAPVRALLALGPPEGEVMSGKPGKPGESKWRAEERPSSPPALLHVLWNDPGRPGRQVAWLRLDEAR